jgi:hypothetical protein
MPPSIGVLGVVQPVELVGVVIEAISGSLGLVVALAVLASRGLLLGALANDVKLFAGQLHDLLQSLFKVHVVPFARDFNRRTAQLIFSRLRSIARLGTANSGPTIPANEIGRLFQPFERLGAARTGHNTGHGLGLSIVKAVADAHDAELSAGGRQDGGLTIDISFPSAMRARSGLTFGNDRANAAHRPPSQRPTGPPPAERCAGVMAKRTCIASPPLAPS